jgi:hypothetical protein
MIISREDRVHNTSLTLPHINEMPVPSPENERPCIYVLGVSVKHLSTIFIMDLIPFLTVWYFCFSLYIRSHVLMKTVFFVHSNCHICFYTYYNTIISFIFSNISNFNLRLYVDYYLSNQKILIYT